jgi:acetolactate synthase-1/2/3 large subunit
MQMFKQKSGQVITTNKSLASMGYGLAGAIGASISNPGKRVILMEGDGGFAQNLQELGTVSVQKLPIKIFLTSNKGYASIRTTQKSYFNGNYVGCDRETGLGLPNWENIGKAFNISSMVINQNNLWGSEMILNMEFY